MKRRILDFSLLAIALVLAVFAAGYAAGRASVKDLVTIELSGGTPMSPTPSAEETVEQTGLRIKLDLNSATVEELETLEGIGETLAKRIVRYREETGGFASRDELLEVYGITEKIYSRIADDIVAE